MEETEGGRILRRAEVLLNGERIIRKTFARAHRTGRDPSWSFIRGRIIYSRAWIFDESGGKILAFMSRTHVAEPEKPRDRNTLTTMRHVPYSSSRDLATAGTQCRHYDARKTNLGKFPRCVRCLTSRSASGTKLRKRLKSPISVNPSVSPINFSTIFIRRIYMGKKNHEAVIKIIIAQILQEKRMNNLNN